MNPIVPAKIFLTRGKGQHREKLVSFEQALRQAGIAPFNLVRVSSIFPPRCRYIPRAEGLKLLKPGQILFVVLSENATDEPGRRISASIGMAVPRDRSHFGYLAEHEDTGLSEKEAGIHTESLAAEMLATKMGAGLRGGGKSGKTCRIATGLDLMTRSVSQTASGASGLWTTVLAAAVLVT